MSHRLMAEVADLEAQLVALDATIAEMMRAAVVDLPALSAARRHRGQLLHWIDEARKAIAR